MDSNFLALNDAKLSATTAIALAVVFTYVLAKRAKQKDKIHKLPTTLPLLGDMLEVARNGDTFHEWLCEQTLRFNGEPWRLQIPGKPDSVIICMPEAIEYVTTKHFDKFPKGEYQISTLETLFGHGLLTSDGERWHHQRKTAAKFFSARVLRSFLNHAIKKSFKRLDDTLEDAMVKGSQVDLNKKFHEFTLDTFVEMALGVDLACLSSSESHPFQHALDSASAVTSLRFRRPAWYWKLEHWLRVGREGTLARGMDVIYGWLNQVIQASMDNWVKKINGQTRSEEDTVAVKSVIELFFESSGDGLEGLQKEDLVDFVLTFIIGARDTTSATLSWFFYALAKNPRVEQRIRDEFSAKVGKIDAETYLTPDHTRELVYFEATIRETLRLYPAGPFTYRHVSEDVTISGGINLRKGETVVMPPYTIARLPQIWGDDAAEFKPERWIDTSTGSLRKISSFQFFSFSAGPRTCVGMNLAMLELRVLLANMLHKYRFDVDLAKNDGSYDMSATLAMKHPLLVRVIKSDLS